MRKRKLQNQFKGTTEVKRKKFLKLNVQKQEQVVGEVREGVTYQTAIDIQPTSAADITMISAPIIPPVLNSINIDDGSYTRVFFDLETSSLAMDCDILQISAIYNDNLFNQYITPTRSINKYASEVTGLTVSHNFLCYNGHRVDSCLPQQALQNFMFWLHNIPSQKLTLLGHKCKRFDMPRLMNTLKTIQSCSFICKKVSGFIDTLPLFRTKFPDLKEPQTRATCTDYFEEHLQSP
ncbi:unnamed protein product [Mytilus coruscus]|uniref:Uncharacterized protein n=1 Tax=Mytilus coruscus TaxID=42192 RepID=A0A6J8AW77_MYTCO|nr:unnamed protein product [Mytilus coruscus]